MPQALSPVRSDFPAPTVVILVCAQHGNVMLHNIWLDGIAAIKVGPDCNR